MSGERTVTLPSETKMKIMKKYVHSSSQEDYMAMIYVPSSSPAAAAAASILSVESADGYKQQRRTLAVVPNGA